MKGLSTPCSGNSSQPRAGEAVYAAAPMHKGGEVKLLSESASLAGSRSTVASPPGKSRAAEKTSQNPLSKAGYRDSVYSANEASEKQEPVFVDDARESASGHENDHFHWQTGEFEELSMDAHELMAQCVRLGVTLAPGPDGKLRVSPPGILPADLREGLRQRKAEVLSLLTKPYLTPNGELRIPFTADRKYHWWAGGQSLAQTLAELDAPPDVWRRYVQGYVETKQ